MLNSVESTEHWYIEQLGHRPHLGGAIDHISRWEVFGNIADVDIELSSWGVIAQGASLNLTRLKLENLGVDLVMDPYSLEEGKLYVGEDFGQYPRIMHKSSDGMSAAAAMFLWAVTAEGDLGQVFERIEEIHVLGDLAGDNPTFFEQVRQYSDDVEREKNPLRSVEIIETRTGFGIDSPRDTLGALRESDAAKMLVSTYDRLQSLYRRISNRAASENDLIEFKELRVSFDDELARVNLELALNGVKGYVPEGLEDDPRYVEFVVQKDSGSARYYNDDWTDSLLGALAPSDFASSRLALRRQSGYKLAIARVNTLRIASAGTPRRKRT